MERQEPLKFKRRRKYKDDEYYHTFKEKMKKENFDHTENCNFPTKTFLKNVKRRKISKQLVCLPKEIQKKIYIWRIKKYWKDSFLNRSLKPLWSDYLSYLNNQLKLSVIDNVHFMHLEFNTLPEYKKWIPSCECRFCKDYQKTHPKEVRKAIKKLLKSEDNSEFCKMVNCYDMIPNKWNQEALYFSYQDDIYSSLEIFDPMKMLYEDIVKESFEDSPMYFSSEVVDVISEIMADEGYSFPNILQEAQESGEGLDDPGEPDEPGEPGEPDEQDEPDEQEEPGEPDEPDEPGSGEESEDLVDPVEFA